jgi:hypothetical protein
VCDVCRVCVRAPIGGRSGGRQEACVKPPTSLQTPTNPKLLPRRLFTRPSSHTTPKQPNPLPTQRVPTKQTANHRLHLLMPVANMESRQSEPQTTENAGTHCHDPPPPPPTTTPVSIRHVQPDVATRTDVRDSCFSVFKAPRRPLHALSVASCRLVSGSVVKMCTYILNDRHERHRGGAHGREGSRGQP